MIKVSDIPKENIKGYEARIVTYAGLPNNCNDDLHVVKEIIHLKDGTEVPNLRLVWNYKRQFWTTSKGSQNHKQKKECESLDNLVEWDTRECDLYSNVAKALGDHGWRGDPRTLKRSPYLYGCDIKSTAILKRAYHDKNKLVGSYKVAVFDTERDVVNGTEQTIMATLSYGKKVYTAVQKSYMEGIANWEQRLHDMMKKYLGEYVDKRQIEWEVLVVDTEIDVIRSCFMKAHEWKPDLMTMWNINYDIKEIVKACERAGVDPKFIFSAPEIPTAYKFFEYIEGPKQKVTASGKVTPIKPADQWHTAKFPASFYIVDAMCVYRKLRVAKGDLPSYALDAILNLVLGIRKLKFKEAEGHTGLKWHQFMQQFYKLEYIIYNVFDCVSMEELDEKVLDCCIAFVSQTGFSDMQDFKSQPKRIADHMHYVALGNKTVFGTTSDKMVDEEIDKYIDLAGWINRNVTYFVQIVIFQMSHCRVNDSCLDI